MIDRPPYVPSGDDDPQPRFDDYKNARDIAYQRLRTLLEEVHQASPSDMYSAVPY